MATALANRLRRLEAIREASNRLMNRPQLQRDIFPRGNPEAIAEIRHPRFTATLFDLLTAYAAQRQQRVLATVHLAKRTVWSLTEARASLERLVGMAEDWSRLDEYLHQLRRRSLAKGHRFCVQLCRGAGNGPGRRGGTAPERGVRAAVFSKASAATRYPTR